MTSVKANLIQSKNIYIFFLNKYTKLLLVSSTTIWCPTYLKISIFRLNRSCFYTRHIMTSIIFNRIVFDIQQSTRFNIQYTKLHIPYYYNDCKCDIELIQTGRYEPVIFLNFIFKKNKLFSVSIYIESCYTYL